jgi:hypothetical protein
MKTTKVLAVAALLVAGLTFTSCKKNYSCECEVLGSKTTADYGKLNKKDGETVEKTCKDADTAAKIVGGSCKFIKG